MKIKEIINHTLDIDRGIINLEFIIEDNPNTTYYLEVEETELEQYCDLYESRDWIDSESEVILGLQETLNSESLHESLESYLFDNPDCDLEVA